MEGERHKIIRHFSHIDPSRCPNFWKSARIGASGKWIDLVEPEVAVVIDEEIDPRKAFAAKGDIDPFRKLDPDLSFSFGDAGRDGIRHGGGSIFSRIVYERPLIENLARRAHSDELVSDHPEFDLPPFDMQLDDDRVVIEKGGLCQTFDLGGTSRAADADARAEMDRLDPNRIEEPLFDFFQKSLGIFPVFFEVHLEKGRGWNFVDQSGVLGPPFMHAKGAGAVIASRIR